MDFRRRSFVLRERDIDDSEDPTVWSMRMMMSPTLSRRRSASPLFTPGVNGGRITAEMIQRNRKEPNFPQSEEEHLYLFHERIIWNQERSLLPLCHDLADWLNSTLGNTYTHMLTKILGIFICFTFI